MDPTDKIHIGKLIRQVLAEQGRNITWLAKQVGCSRENLYKIFKREWIHTDMLQKISLALGYDFFKVYSDWYKRKNVN
ncbi:MAG: helix-turn-helix domain-containing protein [Bacteroidales bacterium]|nr:helix-turn-helix domain-containing protein [Bacteroidales bacterium]